MSNHQKLQKWLDKLGTSLGKSISTADKGLWLLPYLEASEVAFEMPEGSSMLHIYTPLWQPSEIEAPAALQAAMTLNLFQIQTMNGVLAFDNNTGEITFGINLPCDSNYRYRDFNQVAMKFLAYIPHLKTRLIAETRRLPPAADPEQTFTPIRELLPKL